MDLYLIFLNSTQSHSSPTTLSAFELSSFVLELDSTIVIVVVVSAATSAQHSELSEVIIESGLLGFICFGSP
jgi:hypothetical protein